jgi:putative glutamine amidotransferase
MVDLFYNNNMQNIKTKNILIAPRNNKDNSLYKTAGEKLISQYLFAQTDFLPVLACLDKGINSKSQALPIAQKYIDLVDGLVLLGGDHVDPSLYGKEDAGSPSFRDYFEMALIQKALKKGIPIFGICRGFQLLNVYFDGTLLESVKPPKFLEHSFAENNEEFEKINSKPQKPLHHLVKLQQSGVVFKALNKEEIDTNSFHHQGIDKLGTSLESEGKTSDGLVEIISNYNDKILATQFHPELDFESNADYKAIFDLWLDWVKN